eukprot:759666-Hanusia_phi.AAC.2
MAMRSISCSFSISPRGQLFSLRLSIPFTIFLFQPSIIGRMLASAFQHCGGSQAGRHGGERAESRREVRKRGRERLPLQAGWGPNDRQLPPGTWL